MKEGPTITGKTSFFIAIPDQYKTKKTYEDLGKIFGGIPGGAGVGVLTEPRLTIRGVPEGANAFDGDRVLTAANIWATSIYGSAAMRYYPARPMSGLAVHFAMACVAGSLFSAIAGGVKRFPLVFLLGLAAGAAWYFCLVYWNRWIAVYSPQPETFVAYLLFGIVLSRTPSRCVHLAGVFATTA